MRLSEMFLTMVETIFKNAASTRIYENLDYNFIRFVYTNEDVDVKYIYKFESFDDKIRFTRELESNSIESDVKIFEVDNTFADEEEFLLFFLKTKIVDIDMINDDINVTLNKRLCKLVGFTEHTDFVVMKYLKSDFSEFDGDLVIIPFIEYASNNPLNLKKFITNGV